MDELNLKTEIKILKSLLGNGGAITRRRVNRMLSERVDRLLSIEDDNSKDLLKLRLTELDGVTVRMLNTLRSQGIETVKDLVDNYPIDKKIRNLGRKTLIDIDRLLTRNNLI